MEDKKKVISLGILLSILFLISAAYAWLKISVVSDVEHVIHAGKLDLVLDDEASNGINMENVVPTSDTKGKEQDGYQFKLINRGTISSRYTLYLDDLSLEAGAKRMPDSIIKYSLERDGVELSSGLLPRMGVNPNRILDTGTINGKTTYTYLLKVWMDQDATMENQGTIFYTKIRAEAEQSNIPVKKSEMELTPESKEKVPIKDGENPSDYTYTSSDWNVVKVDEEGNIEVIGPGYAVITKTDQYGGKEEITVHVTVPVEATFETNDKIASIGTITNNTCNLTENNQTTCQISLPTVEVVDGYEFVGWSNDSNSHEGKKENIDISLDKKVLYPIVKVPGKELIANIVKQGEGVEDIETDSVRCTVKDTYNDETLNTKCEITLPNMIAKEGYEIIGWSTNSGATTGVAPGSKVEITGNTTYYTIYKKKSKTLTATFLLNGAKSLNRLDASELEAGGKLKLTCTVPESYSGGNQDTSCSIDVPTIEASDATPNVIGFNEDKDATRKSISDTITISENKTYYAITKSDVKTYTATFYRNGAESVDGDYSDTVNFSCNIECTYNGHPQEDSCSITVPSIEASSNTPKVLGFSTEKDLHEDDTEYLIPAEKISLKGNVSYHAQTTNDADIAYTATYQKGSHVVSIEKETDACTIPPSYNGRKREKSCTVEVPDYTVEEGYKKVGYSESKDATTGVTKITLKQDMTYYAIATKVSKTVEYYSEGELAGTSIVGPTENITLRDFEDLTINKTGYHFKGWDTKETASDIVYNNGERIDDLTEGETRKLYAVWIDDIAPVCTFSEFQDSYSVRDTFQMTVTCTDEGSGFVGNPGDMIMPETNSSHFENFMGNGSDLDVINFAFNPKSTPTGVCTYSENKDTMICNFDVNTISATNNGIIKVKEGAVSDKVGNKSKELTSGVLDVKGKTFSATFTTVDIEGVTNGTSTKKSCTTEGPSNFCKINLDDANLKDGYRWSGWGTEKDEKTGNINSISLYANSTFYPLVGPIFEEAYTYNQTAGAENYCVTGEEATCQATTCYQDDGTCPNGTIFKYAVKSDDQEKNYVNSLDDYIYYFYVLHDDGDKLTLQTRENAKREDGSFYGTNWNASEETVADGPTYVIRAVEEATDSWDYVNTINYTMGTTEFLGNANTDCWVDSSHAVHCNKISYSWEPKTAKARVITAQEASNVGCLEEQQSCPIWMYNYSNRCHSKGCPNEESATQENYATMSSAAVTDWAWLIYSEGRLARNNIHNLLRGVRPVIELDKSKLVR